MPTLKPLTVVLRSVSGFTGGLFGTLLLLFVFLLTSKVLNTVFLAEEAGSQGINPVFLVIFLIMVFIGLLSTNLLSTLFISFTDRDKYNRRSSILYQIFIFNIVIFFFAMPFYIFSLVLNFGTLSIVALIHSFLSLGGSHLILEGMSNPRYFLLGVYGTSVGLLLATVATVILYMITGTINMVLFTFLPLSWGFMAIAQCIAELLYGTFYKLYGLDFLKLDTSFGEDTVRKKNLTEEQRITQEVEKEMNTPLDKEGAEFLKGKK